MKTAAPLTILLFAALLGCASHSYQASISLMGRYKDTRDIERKAVDMDWEEGRDVQVYFSQFPEGISIKDNQLIVDKERYDVLGELKLIRRGYSWGWHFYQYPEDQGWRNGYCNAQVPLNWLTLGVLTFLNPLYYPCFVVKKGSVDALADDRERRINELKNITKAAGGNLLIFTSQVSDNMPKAYAIKAR